MWTGASSQQKLVKNPQNEKPSGEINHKLRSSVNPIPDIWGGMETRLSSDDIMRVFPSVKSSDWTSPEELNGVEAQLCIRNSSTP